MTQDFFNTQWDCPKCSNKIKINPLDMYKDITCSHCSHVFNLKNGPIDMLLKLRIDAQKDIKDMESGTKKVSRETLKELRDFLKESDKFINK